MSQFYCFSFILVFLCIQLVTSYISLQFPIDYKSIDAANNIVTYSSPFGHNNMVSKIKIDIHLYLEERHNYDPSITNINCDAIHSSRLNTNFTFPILIDNEGLNQTMATVSHEFHAGNYSIIFFTDEGIILDQAKFDLRIEHYIAPPQYFCRPAMRHFGVPMCDHFHIGRGSYHLFSTTSLSTKPWNITVGKFCSISNVELMLGRSASHRLGFVTTFPLHHMVDPDSLYTDEVVHGSSHSINIGNDVWIGNNAVLINNLTIGHGAVVGANAVVRKSIPPYAIVYGDPAVVVRYRFPAEVVEKLLRMQWWDWEDSRVLAMARYATTEQVIGAWEDGLL